MKNKIKNILDKFVDIKVNPSGLEINSEKLAEMILRELEKEMKGGIKQNGNANLE